MVLSPAHQYGPAISESWMGNITLKGSPLTRWQTRHNLKAAILFRKYRSLEVLLLRHGVACQAVRVNKQGDTLLMLAIRKQYEPAVQLLLKYNAANPNLTNNSGSSALDLALLVSTCPANYMDEYITLLSCITREVSTNVLTSVLDPEAQDPERVIKTAALLVMHSQHYMVRAKVLYTLLKYYPALIKPMLINGSDPTGVTDLGIDTKRLWGEVINLRYFKQPVLEIIPPDLVLLLIRAANGSVAIDLLVELVMNSLQVVGLKPTQAEMQFHWEALKMLAKAGYQFLSDEMEIICLYLPEVAKWYQKSICGQVPSLMSLARHGVRTSMQCNALYSSSVLPLPVTIQRYLCME